MLGSLHREHGPGTRSEEMRSRAARPRSAVRRMVFHRRVDDAHLLPAHLPRQAGPVAQRGLLPHRGRRRARGVPPLLAVSTRGGAGDAGVARRRGDGLTRAATHRARIPRRRQEGRGPRGHARYDGPAPAPIVRAPRGRLADRRRDDPARAARENPGRRDGDADVRDRVRGGVRQHPTLQRRVSRGLPEAADGRSPSQARARRAPETPRSSR